MATNTVRFSLQIVDAVGGGALFLCAQFYGQVVVDVGIAVAVLCVYTLQNIVISLGKVGCVIFPDCL